MSGRVLVKQQTKQQIPHIQRGAPSLPSWSDNGISRDQKTATLSRPGASPHAQQTPSYVPARHRNKSRYMTPRPRSREACTPPCKHFTRRQKDPLFCAMTDILVPDRFPLRGCGTSTPPHRPTMTKNTRKTQSQRLHPAISVSDPHAVVPETRTRTRCRGPRHRCPGRVNDPKAQHLRRQRWRWTGV